MATGDARDITARLQRWLPTGWFPGQAVNADDTVPRVYAQLVSWASALASIWSQLSYAALQTRIATLTDGWVDLAAYDFFGLFLPRRMDEADATYSARIRREVLRQRNTRAAVARVLVDLTGIAPVIFEPARPADTGVYGTLNNGISGCLSTQGYGVAGRYGSLLLPYQAFIDAFPPLVSGIPNVAGYGEATYPGPTLGGPGGYGVGAIEYGDLDMIVGALTEDDIFAAIDSVKPVATIMWTRIDSSWPFPWPPQPEVLDIGTTGGSPFE